MYYHLKGGVIFLDINFPKVFEVPETSATHNYKKHNEGKKGIENKKQRKKTSKSNLKNNNYSIDENKDEQDKIFLDDYA